MINALIQAINDQAEISFTYSGLARVAQPSAVGISTTGNEILRCLQTEGGHITSSHVWDLCTVSKISHLQLTGNTFNTAPPDYKKDDKAMQRIYAQL